MNWLAAVVLLVAATTFADPAHGQTRWLDSPQVTGQWFGVRPALAEQGITVLADSTNFYFGNTAGGVRETFDFSGHGDYVLNVDAGKLGGPEGFFVKLRAEHRYGESVTDDVGAFFSPTLLSDLPVFDSDQLYLTNVLLTQMLSESVAVFAGKMDTLDGDLNAFAHGRGKTQFSNLAFVFNPIVSATVPYSTLGAGLMLFDEGLPTVTLSVLNAVDTTSTSGFSELGEEGVLLSAFVRLPTSFFGRPGHQALGGTWNSRSYSSLGEAYVQYPDLVIPTTNDSWSLYWNCDQYLVVDAVESTRGWGLFGRAGVADDNTNPLAWFLSCGLGGSVPFHARAADSFGVGWYFAGLSSKIGPVFTSFFGPTGDGQGVELFYNYALTPAIRLTPDVQVMVPALRDVDPVLIVGLRAQVVF